MVGGFDPSRTSPGQARGEGYRQGPGTTVAGGPWAAVQGRGFWGLECWGPRVGSGPASGVMQGNPRLWQRPQLAVQPPLQPWGLGGSGDHSKDHTDPRRLLGQSMAWPAGGAAEPRGQPLGLTWSLGPGPAGGGARGGSCGDARVQGDPIPWESRAGEGCFRPGHRVGASWSCVRIPSRSLPPTLFCSPQPGGSGPGPGDLTAPESCVCLAPTRGASARHPVLRRPLRHQGLCQLFPGHRASPSTPAAGLLVQLGPRGAPELSAPRPAIRASRAPEL